MGLVMDRNFKNLFGFALAPQMFSLVTKREEMEILNSLDTEENVFLFPLTIKIENRDEATCSYPTLFLQCPWLTKRASKQHCSDLDIFCILTM